MLAGLEKTSRNDSESRARKVALGKISQADETTALMSLPHKGAVFRYNPPVFD
jgi:hypothetical protein